MSVLQTANIFDLSASVPAAVLTSSAETYREAYERNRHRIYALAFRMSDHELAAEALMINAFSRAFAGSEAPTAEEIDRALVAELREYMPLGTLTLSCAPSEKVLGVRRNTLRVELECAVVQLPATERLIFLMHDVEGYEHSRIARTLGLTLDQSINGLHQARLRMRELLAR